MNGNDEGHKLARLLHRFATAAKAHYQALETMDEEQANRQAQIIAGVFHSLVQSGENGRKALLELVDDHDPVIAGMAAVYSIRLDSRRCLTTLRRISSEPGLLGMRAEAVVERWESGEWQGPED